MTQVPPPPPLSPLNEEIYLTCQKVEGLITVILWTHRFRKCPFGVRSFLVSSFLMLALLYVDTISSSLCSHFNDIANLVILLYFFETPRNIKYGAAWFAVIRGIWRFTKSVGQAYRVRTVFIHSDIMHATVCGFATREKRCKRIFYQLCLVPINMSSTRGYKISSKSLSGLKWFGFVRKK